MKSVTVIVAVGLTVLATTGLAYCEEVWIPDIPPELGVRAPARVIAEGYRCSDGPVYNFYDGALYDRPPAVYRGYAYRPYYGYTATRLDPRIYACRRP